MASRKKSPVGLLGYASNAPESGGRLLGNVYGAERRTPYSSELDYFQDNPQVAGMAAEDNSVILNPWTNLSPTEFDAVAQNEASRIYMRKNGYPAFDLTPEQQAFLANTPYGNAPEHERKATIAARILSGDPTSGTPTAQQIEYVRALTRAMSSK